jgi:hypothetical protein
MTLEEATTAMHNRIPVFGPKPARPLLIESIKETPYGPQAQLRETSQAAGSMQIVVNAQDPAAFIADLDLATS